MLLSVGTLDDMNAYVSNLYQKTTKVAVITRKTILGLIFVTVKSYRQT